jgi:hypothetical protein
MLNRLVNTEFFFKIRTESFRSGRVDAPGGTLAFSTFRRPCVEVRNRLSLSKSTNKAGKNIVAEVQFF